MEKRIVVLLGGVGGAKLALGLASLLKPQDVTFVVNTGDDFEYLGLNICPDLDTVMYTLAGANNPQTGWGLKDETWNFSNAVKRFVPEHWFSLGDKDLATHVERTRRLRSGESLTGVTKGLSHAFGVSHSILPMSDLSAPTFVHAEGMRLSFQDYFVRLVCEPRVSSFEYGSAHVAPSAAVLDALGQASTVIICPSNPFLSIAPILSLKGLKALLAEKPVIAVSPIVKSQALKGPTAKIMSELGLPVTSTGIAAYYEDLIDGFVIDSRDEDQKQAIENMRVACFVTNTIMSADADKIGLARHVLEFAECL